MPGRKGTATRAALRTRRRTSPHRDFHADNEDNSHLGSIDSTGQIHNGANRDGAKLSPARWRGQGILKSCHLPF